ncbi:hypothetical protein BV25DRAFT_1818820 [Artomyces pyxidatus]|uniref:Uncharacterized protein n=1 Tax=Artomyces pyxidatus TaxID=48021 RepID=A0ACB8TJ52_9AGAM|nr:hypothetical protein BV25DRAFT_1818820 [Artomyces pyxidatus]
MKHALHEAWAAHHRLEVRYVEEVQRRVETEKQLVNERMVRTWSDAYRSMEGLVAMHPAAQAWRQPPPPAAPREPPAFSPETFVQVLEEGGGGTAGEAGAVEEDARAEVEAEASVPFAVDEPASAPAPATSAPAAQSRPFDRFWSCEGTVLSARRSLALCSSCFFVFADSLNRLLPPSTAPVKQS